MATTIFDPATFDTAKFNELCDRGLSSGQGSREGQMCIEAVICATMGLPHGDDPGCVAASVRSFKIRLNDSASLALEVLRDLGSPGVQLLDSVKGGA